MTSDVGDAKQREKTATTPVLLKVTELVTSKKLTGSAEHTALGPLITVIDYMLLHIAMDK